MDGPGLTAALLPLRLVALLALVPATAAWLSDGWLRRAAADPTLPERLVQRQQRLAALTALIIAVVLVLGGGRQLWIVPVVWLLLQVATHRTRRWLHDETWTAGAQIRWNYCS